MQLYIVCNECLRTKVEGMMQILLVFFPAKVQQCSCHSFSHFPRDENSNLILRLKFMHYIQLYLFFIFNTNTLTKLHLSHSFISHTNTDGGNPAEGVPTFSLFSTIFSPHFYTMTCTHIQDIGSKSYTHLFGLSRQNLIYSTFDQFDPNPQQILEFMFLMC